MSFDIFLFETMGPLATSLALCGILAIVGMPAAASLLCREGVFRRLQRGR